MGVGGGSTFFIWERYSPFKFKITAVMATHSWFELVDYHHIFGVSWNYQLDTNCSQEEDYEDFIILLDIDGREIGD